MKTLNFLGSLAALTLAPALAADQPDYHNAEVDFAQGLPLTAQSLRARPELSCMRIESAGPKGTRKLVLTEANDNKYIHTYSCGAGPCATRETQGFELSKLGYLTAKSALIMRVTAAEVPTTPPKNLGDEDLLFKLNARDNNMIGRASKAQGESRVYYYYRCL